MKLLLDTHTLLWTVAKTEKLSERAKKAITDIGNDVFFSSVSLWEIAIKYNLKKLELPNIDILKIPSICEEMGFAYTDISPMNAITSFQLPYKNDHRDPFDRMLIHLAIKNNYTLVTCDSKAALYETDGLKHFW
jgi:PIN domain nuclease of toxin-antitoxin system